MRARDLENTSYKEQGLPEGNKKRRRGEIWKGAETNSNRAHRMLRSRLSLNKRGGNEEVSQDQVKGKASARLRIPTGTLLPVSTSRP